MACCGGTPLTDGRPAAGGGDASAFSEDFVIVGAASHTSALATLVPNGSNVLLRNVALELIFTAGAPAGDIGQINFGGAIQAQRSTTDAQVVIFGVPPWGPPPGTPPLNSTGYQPPLAFGSPGGVACVLQATGSQLEIVTTGIGGFTITGRLRGQIEVFDGAVRLIA